MPAGAGCRSSVSFILTDYTAYCQRKPELKGITFDISVSSQPLPSVSYIRDTSFPAKANKIYITNFV
jgi:hypothetical protein